MFAWLGRLLGYGGKRRNPPPARPRAGRGQVRARYDAAQTTAGNAKHWGGADGLGPVAANWAGTRYVLRNRARYEYENNSYCGGMVETLANDSIGTGPRPQVRSADPAFDAAVEARFREWAGGVIPGQGEDTAGIGLAGKLRLARQTRTALGEVFLLLTTDAETARPVKLDVTPLEPDHVDTPYGGRSAHPNVWEGVEYGPNRKPVAYHVAREHPGDGTMGGMTWDRVEARHVVHWFKPKRCGQVRGVPEITAALPLFNDLRRYTLASVAAAETAASVAAVLESDAPADGEDAVEGEPFETFELERGSLMNLPSGHRLGQVKAEQPTTTYPAFKREIVSEVGRGLHMPYNVAAGDSSTYNYASGRLDHTEYGDATRVEQAETNEKVLDRVFAAWYREARLVPGHLPPQPAGGFTLSWQYDGSPHVDPVKEATAQQQRLQNSTTTLRRECELAGLDWEEVLAQRARERRRMAELGIPDPAAPVAPPPPATDPEEEESADA